MFHSSNICDCAYTLGIKEKIPSCKFQVLFISKYFIPLFHPPFSCPSSSFLSSTFFIAPPPHPPSFISFFHRRFLSPDLFFPSVPSSPLFSVAFSLSTSLPLPPFLPILSTLFFLETSHFQLL